MSRVKWRFWILVEDYSSSLSSSYAYEANTDDNCNDLDVLSKIHNRIIDNDTSFDKDEMKVKQRE